MQGQERGDEEPAKNSKGGGGERKEVTARRNTQAMEKAALQARPISRR